MPLRKDTVDIYPLGVDQLPSSHQGGMGRLTDLRNAEINHFDPPAAGKPQFLNLKQRRGFTNRPRTGHSHIDGSSTGTLSWNGARLLAVDSKQNEISITRSKPRVWDGTDWTDYPKTRVLTNKLTARPWYTPQAVTQATTSAWLSSVTCEVHTEITNAGNVSDAAVTSVVACFRADDGTWIRSPFVVQSGGAAGELTMARVVHDGTQFWILATDHNGGNPKINVRVYDLNGQALASSVIDMTWDVLEPGYWDVARRSSTSEIVLVQPNGNDPEVDNDVVYSRMTYAASVITVTTQTDTGPICNGPVKFAKNFQDTKMYLITTGPSELGGGLLYGYQLNVVAGTLQSIHEYDFGITLAAIPDTLVGFTSANSSGSVDPNAMDLTVSFGIPAIATTYGAAFDPALRYIKSYRCDYLDVATFQRQTNSVCAVSDAFPIDDDWYCVTYYQSGSGEAEESLETVTVEAGDGMYGAAEQPITLSFGDATTGSPQLFLGAGVQVSTAQASDTIAAPDKVESLISDNTFPTYIPVGTPLLKWTLQNLASIDPTGSRLVVDSSDIPTANFTWDIVDGSVTPGVFYTLAENTNGGTVVPGNFTTGNFEITSMAGYTLPGFVDKYYNLYLASLVPVGDIVVTGSGIGGNNGTFTVERINYNIPSAYGLFGSTAVLWVNTTTQGATSGTFNASVEPTTVNEWGFSAALFDDSYINTILSVQDDSKPENNGEHTVTDSTDSNSITTGNATQLVPEQYVNIGQFEGTYKIVLDPIQNQVPYTFVLQGVTFDYRYLNAIISLSGAAHTDNDGLYRIIQIVDTDTVRTVPVSTAGTIVRNELFDTDPAPTITIQLQAATSPQLQPQWFITPIGDITSAQVGNCELGIAYADWRREALTEDLGTANPWLLHVAQVSTDNDGQRLHLPFRAITTTEESSTVLGGFTSSKAIPAAIVGVKQFKILNTYGTICADLIPGCMAAKYDGGLFTEAGILIGLEQPSLYSEQVSDNVALVANQTYFYAACLEATETGTGRRIWTAPTPNLEVVLTGNNTSVTLTGRLPIPLNSDGSNVAGNFFGVSNRLKLTLSLYRTCIINGLPTTDLYKITSDLLPNATAPISDTNDSGFAFPDEFTWTYTDENLDSIVSNNEKLYTNVGLLPRFHPPAFHSGAQGWQERNWLLAYDGAVWFDGPVTEGQDDWYSPLFRSPTPFEPTAVGNLETFLAGFALDSKWYLPNFEPPGATIDTARKIPSWQQLKLEGGCTGPILTTQGGLVYASNFGGAWKLTRDLQDQWLSKDYVDDFASLTVSSLAVDKKQRLAVLVGSNVVYVLDQISSRWSKWTIGAVPLSLSCTKDGYFNSQSSDGVIYYDPDRTNDELNSVVTGCPLGFTFASINFGKVAGLKAVWQFQARGRYKGAHDLVGTISYTDENATTPDTDLIITPDPTKPYVIDFEPTTDFASSYDLEFDADFTDVEVPGDSFELDLISAEVGLDSRSGINRSTQEMANG